MKIAGLWSGHDCSFCILDDGAPVIHAEYERYIREKEPKGDSVSFMREVLQASDIEEISAFATCFPRKHIMEHESHKWLASLGKDVFFMGHHQAHAAHAFFSSKFQEAAILTIDGGGVETNQGHETATTIWYGKDNKIHHVSTLPPHTVNIGGLWTRVTRYVFKLQNGWPYGHQAGSVMAMAALGDRDKYFQEFVRMLTVDVIPASMKPKDQPVGPYTGNDPVHPYLQKWALIAERSEQDKFDLAASLQAATEFIIRRLVEQALQNCNGAKNVCIAGGVALNSVTIGKIRSWFPGKVEAVYVPPVPYDGGLAIGAAQYIWHQRMDNPRINWEDNFTPYLGENHNTVSETLQQYGDQLEVVSGNDDDLVDLLDSGKIVAVFNGLSESGRRALGNRSILADPRDPDMKDKINEKVKHRQWYRPFAPSIMRESVSDWFVEDVDSPYMTHVIKFKDEALERVPAVVHFDGTARLQTVTANDNEWYYNFLTKWNEKSGVPIILNTSFNDREPICETPGHAIRCFLGTDIDRLYFPTEGLLVSKKETK